MREFLILRLDGPLQAWGDVAVDSWRPTRSFPSLSALTGLIASALGWTYRNGALTTQLQSHLRYAVLEERTPRVVEDFQTADLARIGVAGWTRWGLERRGGANATGTQPQRKQYLADGSFIVALSVDDGAPVSLDAVEAALNEPARPLFLGRKGCPPASRMLVGRVTAETGYDALAAWAVVTDTPEPWRGDSEPWCWYANGEGPTKGRQQTIWDMRNFESDRFAGSRTISRRRMKLPHAPDPSERLHGE